MEALAAVSLAGNIVQFTQFAITLLNNTRKLHLEVSDVESEQNHIRKICDHLESFNAKLRPPSSTSSEPLAASHNAALAKCASDCRKDCTQLQIVMRSIRKTGDAGPKIWSCFRSALAQELKASEIETLRARLADHQRAMMLQLCQNSNDGIVWLQQRMEELIYSAHGTRSGRRGRDESAKFFRKRMTNLEKGLNDLGLDNDERAVTAFCSQLDGLREDIDSYEFETKVLESLDFADRCSRHATIVEAHEDTFQWGLTTAKGGGPVPVCDVTVDGPDHRPAKRRAKEDDNASASNRLHEWLTSDNDCFWVSGRAGSGKSTFMKYIADHKDTYQRLKLWASPKKLLFTSHYFTIYGSDLQKSLEGLLRSSLYGILESHPELIRTALDGKLRRNGQLPSWTILELRSALLAIAEAEDLPVKICLFIDGLDEYEGDHLDICKMIKGLARSPCVKICVSSRHWNVFEDAFGFTSESKIYMHELNRQDIQSFISARLQEHDRWSTLIQDSGERSARDLIDEVVCKSNGVFLWVYLVTKMLRNGLTNDDSMSDLLERVNSSPSDLDTYFKRMIDSVEPFYHKKMATTLIVALEAREPLDIPVYHFVDKVVQDAEYAFRVPGENETLNTERQTELIERTVRRLNGWCKGLLEPEGTKINFLHRTVYDYLRSPKIYALLKDLSPQKFCSKSALFKALSALFMRSYFPCEDTDLSSAGRTLPGACGDFQGAAMATFQSAYFQLIYVFHTMGQWELDLIEVMENHLDLMSNRGQLGLLPVVKARVIFRHGQLMELETPTFLERITGEHYFEGFPVDNVWSPLPRILQVAVRSDALYDDRLPQVTKRLLDLGYHPAEAFVFFIHEVLVKPQSLSAVIENQVLVQLLVHVAAGPAIPQNFLWDPLRERENGETSIRAYVLLLACKVSIAQWPRYESIGRIILDNHFHGLGRNLKMDLLSKSTKASVELGGEETTCRSPDGHSSSCCDEQQFNHPERSHEKSGNFWYMFREGHRALTDRVLGGDHHSGPSIHFIMAVYASILEGKFMLDYKRSIAAGLYHQILHGWILPRLDVERKDEFERMRTCFRLKFEKSPVVDDSAL